jgi:hypothetical protein
MPVGQLDTVKDSAMQEAAGGAADPTPLRPRPVTAPRLGWTHQLLGLDSDVTGPPVQPHGNPSTSRRPSAARQDCPESPCRVGQDGAQRPVPTTRPWRPALRAARAATQVRRADICGPDPAGSPNSGKSIRPPLSQGARLSTRASESRSSVLY